MCAISRAKETATTPSDRVFSVERVHGYVPAVSPVILAPRCSLAIRSMRKEPQILGNCIDILIIQGIPPTHIELANQGRPQRTLLRTKTSPIEKGALGTTLIRQLDMGRGNSL